MFGGLCEHAHTYRTGTGGLEAAAAGGAILGQSHTPSLVVSIILTPGINCFCISSTHTHAVHTDSRTGRAYTHATATNLEASIHLCFATTTATRHHHAHNNCRLCCMQWCLHGAVYSVLHALLASGEGAGKGNSGPSTETVLVVTNKMGRLWLTTTATRNTAVPHHRHKPPTST